MFRRLIRLCLTFVALGALLVVEPRADSKPGAPPGEQARDRWETAPPAPERSVGDALAGAGEGNVFDAPRQAVAAVEETAAMQYVLSPEQDDSLGWHQEAHDAQHTGFIDLHIPMP